MVLCRNNSGLRKLLNMGKYLQVKKMDFGVLRTCYGLLNRRVWLIYICITYCSLNLDRTKSEEKHFNEITDIYQRKKNLFHSKGP